jgi:hypothetical protein
MRRLPRFLLVAVLGLASAFLVACGDRSKLIPGSEAQRLKSQIDSVSAAVDAHSCGRAQLAAQNLQDAVNNLPRSVDPGLRTRLQDGATRMAAAAADECQRTTTQTTPTVTETTTTPTQTETTTTPTQTETNTTPTTTTTTPTTPTPTTTQPGTGGAGAP